jgi:NAD(P)-dependent dehydrogenase (short-subunit alcohol dehydrogenase family)
MLQNPNLMKNKIALVTGSSRGIGYYTAYGLAQMGAQVIIVSHHKGRCETAVEKIKNKTGNDLVRYYVADLSALDEIRHLAEKVKQDIQKLDVLINNVGGWYPKRQETVDGIELTFALNHLSYFLLTGLLLDLLHSAPNARIINVTSDAHRTARKIEFNNLEFSDRYKSFAAYAQSKLANLLFTYELAERLSHKSITVNAVHPGLVRSEFYSDFGFVGKVINLFISMFGKNSMEGADTPIYVASSPELKEVSGKYFVDRQKKNSSNLSYDQSTAQRLWQISEEMTEFIYPD